MKPQARPAPPCQTCNRVPKEGCSVVECPHRRPQTAGYETHLGRGGEGYDGCYHTQPTNKE